MTREINIHPVDCFHKNSPTTASQIQHPRYIELQTLKGEKDGGMIIKSGCMMNGKK
jgi:hypothetical protein